MYELPDGDGHVECGEDDGGNYECQTARVEHVPGRFGPNRRHTLFWVPATITRWVCDWLPAFAKNKNVAVAEEMLTTIGMLEIAVTPTTAGTPK